MSYFNANYVMYKLRFVISKKKKCFYNSCLVKKLLYHINAMLCFRNIITDEKILIFLEEMLHESLLIAKASNWIRCDTFIDLFLRIHTVAVNGDLCDIPFRNITMCSYYCCSFVFFYLFIRIIYITKSIERLKFISEIHFGRIFKENTKYHHSNCIVD